MTRFNLDFPKNWQHKGSHIYDSRKLSSSLVKPCSTPYTKQVAHIYAGCTLYLLWGYYHTLRAIMDVNICQTWKTSQGLARPWPGQAGGTEGWPNCPCFSLLMAFRELQVEEGFWWAPAWFCGRRKHFTNFSKPDCTTRYAGRLLLCRVFKSYFVVKKMFINWSSQYNAIKPAHFRRSGHIRVSLYFIFVSWFITTKKFRPKILIWDIRMFGFKMFPDSQP